MPDIWKDIEAILGEHGGELRCLTAPRNGWSKTGRGKEYP